MLPPVLARWLPAGILVALVALVFIELQTSHASARHLRSGKSVLHQRHGRNNHQQPLQMITVTRTAAVATATVTELITKTKPTYIPGQADPHREYSKAVIVASIKKENTSWVAEQVPDLERFIYVNDDPEAPYTVPKNKFNEVMSYLTFVIDHYDTLPDILIFVHAHDHTHHNPPLMRDTAMLIKNLNPQRVMREGYMNLNCGNWEAGQCTAQMRPAEGLPFGHHKDAWQALFPEYPIPAVLAQFCCAQFAVSRDRVQQIPLATFRRWRQLLIDSDFPDLGFFFEYLWQFIFKGEHVYCPASHQCFCDGFGICFGGEKQYRAFNRLESGKLRLVEEADFILLTERGGKTAKKDGLSILPEHDHKRLDSIRKSIEDFDIEIERLTKDAFARGRNPKLRAQELGKQWESGEFL